MHYIATLLVVFVGGLAAEDILFDFGASAGDVELPTALDGFSRAINITGTGFMFFGNSYENVYVSCAFLLTYCSAVCFWYLGRPVVATGVARLAVGVLPRGTFCKPACISASGMICGRVTPAS